MYLHMGYDCKRLRVSVLFVFIFDLGLCFALDLQLYH
jgi:hypothetical protein